MITTVTLNPALDRVYYVSEHGPGESEYIYEEQAIRVYPGGKGLLSAIDLVKLGNKDVQNLGFVGGKQGLFFEKMVQEYRVTTNYIYTDNEIRNNVFIIGRKPVSYTHYNDYTYRVKKKDVEQLLKRFGRAIVDSECVLISGSIPGGIDFDIYEEMTKICNEQDKRVFLQASGEALNLSLRQNPKVIMPYFKHTKRIFNRDIIEFEDYITACRQLISNGAEHVIIPYHCDRLLFVEDRVYSLSPEDFCLSSWLGAGDAYNAAFMDHVLHRGFDFIEANRYGAAAALAIAEKRGIFLDNRKEIEDNLDRIMIKELEV